MRFAYTPVFLLLPVTGWWLYYAYRRRPATLYHSMTGRIAYLAGKQNRIARLLPRLLRAGCFLFLILAAARPQLVNVFQDVRSSGVDMMLCLDTSGSMEAVDFEFEGRYIARIQALKKVIKAFVMKRKWDRIGLVVFGREAFTQCPLTLDKRLLRKFIDRMQVGMAGDLTAMGAGIAVAAKRLKDLQAESKVIILVTDGKNNVPTLTPQEAARAAHALGIRIYTVGIGAEGPAPFREETLFGPRLFYEKTGLDEGMLKAVARWGGGEYFRAKNTTDLSRIYDIIDRLEKTEINIRKVVHYKELFSLFLLPALVLLAMEIGLRNTALRTIP